MSAEHSCPTFSAQMFKHGVARFGKESVEEHPHTPKTPSAHDTHTQHFYPILPSKWRHTSSAESAPTTKGHSQFAHPHRTDETTGHHADLQVQSTESVYSL